MKFPAALAALFLSCSNAGYGVPPQNHVLSVLTLADRNNLRRGLPQSESEESESNRSECRYRSIIFTSGDTPAGSVQFQPDDRFDEQGAFFVKGVIGMVGLAIFYALLEGIRRAYERAHKNNSRQR